MTLPSVPHEDFSKLTIMVEGKVGSGSSHGKSGNERETERERKAAGRYNTLLNNHILSEFRARIHYHGSAPSHEGCTP